MLQTFLKLEFNNSIGSPKEPFEIYMDIDLDRLMTQLIMTVKCINDTNERCASAMCLLKHLLPRAK